MGRSTNNVTSRAAPRARRARCHPAMTRILRQHTEDEQLQSGDLLFQGESGGILAGSVIRRAWRGARESG